MPRSAVDRFSFGHCCLIAYGRWGKKAVADY
jgi:hypothetical protein